MLSLRLLAIALISLASPLYAASITRDAPIVSTFEVSTSGAYPEFVGVGTNTSSLLLPEFDPSLGTLTSVELTISLNIATFTTVTNSVMGIIPGPPPTPIPVSLLLTPSNEDALLLSVAGIPFISTSSSSLPIPTVIPPGSGAVSTSSTTLNATNLGSPFFSFFTGEGIASASIMSTDTYMLQSEGLGAPSFAGVEVVTPALVTLSGDLSAVYTYTPAVTTPEPAFTPVIGFFLVAWLAARRRSAGDSSHACIALYSAHRLPQNSLYSYTQNWRRIQ